jgi:hypothetical protein
MFAVEVFHLDLRPPITAAGCDHCGGGALPQVGAPPPLRGVSAEQQRRFAIACRACAVVLDLEGHQGHAAHLRELAQDAEQAAAAGAERPRSDRRLIRREPNDRRHPKRVGPQRGQRDIQGTNARDVRRV